MIELHGWLSVSETYNNEDYHTKEELDAIMLKVHRIVKESDCDINSQYLNGTLFLHTLICSNHRTPQIDMVIDTYKLITETATGSYGMIYIRDDEDNIHYNEFQVYIYKKGKCYYRVDNELSPCIPEIESGE